MRKRYLILTAVSLVLLVTGLIAGQYFRKQSHRLIPPKRGDIVEAVYGLGTVKSHEFYEFKAGVVTHLDELFVKEGDSVARGQPLVRLSDPIAVTAPFDGIVTDLPFHEGENIPAHQMVVQLQNLSRKYVEVSLEQESALRIVKGQKAKIMFESIRGIVHEGVVTARFPRQGNFIVHIAVDDLTPNILPGMTTDVSIEIGHHENALLIPVSSIDAGQVIRVRDGHKKRVAVTIGHIDGNWAEVVAGDILLEDDILIPNIGKEK